MRNVIWLAIAGLLISIHSFAGSAPSDACQFAAFRAAAGTLPSGSKMTGVFTLSPSFQPQLNQYNVSAGTVVLIGEVSEHEFTVRVHVRYLGSRRNCQVYQVENLDWGDHI
jgi:hypothetical protein